MKKVLSIFILLVLVISSCVLLVGCSSNKAEATLFTGNYVQEVSNKGNSNIYTVKLVGKQRVDTMILEEKTDNVRNFGVYGKEDDGTYKLIYRQNRIDKYRVCAMEAIETDELRIEIFDKYQKGSVKISNVEVYNSATCLRENSFRVTEYLLTTNRKLYNNKSESAFYNHLKGVNDVVIFGDISIDQDASIRYNEGNADFEEDLSIIKLWKEDEKKLNDPNLNVIVNIDLRSYIIPEDTPAKKQNSTVQKWMKKNYKTVASNIVNFVNTYSNDIAGINLDWQYPANSTQWSYLSKMIIEIKNALPEGKYITIDLKPDNCNLTKKARNAIEYVNLMTYDMFDERGEHASNYETCKHSVETFIKKSKFTADKIMLGISLYGRTTNGSSQVYNLYEKFNYRTDEKQYNLQIDKWVNKIYNYSYTDETGSTIYSDVFLNGYAMIRDKVTYAIASGLGGASVFRMAYDVSANWAFCLNNAVKEAVNRGVKQA